MKIITILLFLFSFQLSSGQTIFKVSGSLGNRWDEKLNSQTIGKGFRISGESFLTTNLSFDIGVSYFSFDPTTLVNVSFNSYLIGATYYFTQTKLQPFVGFDAGFCKYQDKTTIEIPGQSNTQVRDKQYGSISPKLGLIYFVTDQIGVQLQFNADFVPIANISPIGFSSSSLGVVYKIGSRKLENK